MTKNKLKLTKWDITEQLKTEKDIKGFLEAAFEEAGDDSARRGPGRRPRQSRRPSSGSRRALPRGGRRRGLDR